jgi:hypothetical protein
MHNFIGKDNFVWWIGRVENRADPLGLGRCQVRIFGHHGDGSDKSLADIPSDTLPWAQPLYPINGSKSFSAPMINEWVLGFFLDGLSAQAPVMLGILPAYLSELPNSVPGKKSEPAVAQLDPNLTI